MSPAPLRAVVTEHEALAASALVSEWRHPVGPQLTPSQLGTLRAMIAAGLADAREGATIPGDRQRVGAVLDVSARVWLQAPDLHGSHRQDVRRRWAQELERNGARPLGWPPVTVEYLRFRRPDGTEQPPTVADPFVQCENADQADLVRLTISGLAVPL